MFLFLPEMAPSGIRYVAGPGGDWRDGVGVGIPEDGQAHRTAK